MLDKRLFYGIGLAVTILLMAAAFFFQYVLELEPCPLCMVQRFAVVAVGLVCLVALIHHPGLLWQRLYGLFVSVIAGFGLAVAGRHVWLQQLPDDQVPACGADLEYLLSNFPLTKAVEIILSGSGECHDVAWSFMGLTMPAWMIVVFAIFIVVGLSQLINPKLLIDRN